MHVNFCITGLMISYEYQVLCETRHSNEYEGAMQKLPVFIITIIKSDYLSSSVWGTAIFIITTHIQR